MLALWLLPMTGRAHPYDDHIANGSAFLRNGHYALAAAEFEAAYLLRKDPGIALQLGRIYLKLHQAAGAQRYCSAYLRLTGSLESDPEREEKAHECVNQANQLMRTGTSSQKQAARRPLTQKAKPVPTVPTISAQPLTEPLITLTLRSATLAPLASEEEQAPLVWESTDSHTKGRLVPLHKRWWLWSLAGVTVSSVIVGVTVAMLRTTTSAPTPVDPLAEVPKANQIVVMDF